MNLFSPQGVASRGEYWAITIFTGAISKILEKATAYETAPVLIIGLLLITLGWAGLCVAIKRCHDLNKSGWFLLWSLIPVIGALYVVIQLGFIRGGESDYA